MWDTYQRLTRVNFLVPETNADMMLVCWKWQARRWFAHIPMLE
jgi:hypothetical protein